MKKILLVLLTLWAFPFSSVSAVILESTKSASINVEARIAARGQDILFDFTSDKVNQTVGADTEVTYTISYGSLLSYGTPMTIVAEWSLGTVPDQTLYSYNILSYVTGSATKDYWGESTPTVDIINRRITWIIRRFPPNTIGKTLSFKLKTPGIYVTDRNVNFNVRAKLTQSDVSKDWINLEGTYSPTDFIRKEIRGLQFLTIDVRRITDSSFSLFLVTSVPTKTVISYGLSPDNLDQTFTDSTFAEQKLLTIDGLSPSTTYYFRILIENDKGIQRKTPEVFQVATSSTSLVSLIDQDRVYISSRGVLLRNESGIGPGTTIVVPASVPIEVFLPFRSGVPTNVHLVMESKNVLGISTDTTPPRSEQKVRLLETQARTFTGIISAPVKAGQYDLVIEAVGDLTGTNRDILTTVVVSEPITIVNSQGRPIENALVYIERYDHSIKNYVYFPASTYGSRNPLYTDSYGIADFVLPVGEYTINVNAIGYETRQQKFTFNPAGSAPYPQLVLLSAPFQLTSIISYYWSDALDLVQYVNWNIDYLAGSYRFLDTSLLISIMLLTALSLLANLHRVKVTLEGFLIYFEKKMLSFFHKPKPENVFIGFVEQSESGHAIHGATVMLTDKKTKALAGRDITNSLGEFHLRLDPTQEYDMTIRKNSFVSHRETVGAGTLLVGHSPIRLERESGAKSHPVITFFGFIIRSTLHGLSDTLLFTVGILNLILWLRLGVKVLPTTIITGISALLWMEYEWHVYQSLKRSAKI